MLYPIYLHIGDETHAHGVTIPDFPGCFTSADSWEDLPRAVQGAAELYFEGEETKIPPPTPIERLAQDPAYQGGVWMLMEIDVSRLHRAAATSAAGAASREISPLVHEVTEPFREASTEFLQPERVELALPEDLLKVVDDFARGHGLSRSTVLERAAETFVQELARKK